MYQQGAKKYQNNWPQQSNVFQGQGLVVNPVIQLPRIDCGIVIPSQWALEQFAEMAKTLKHIEDKHRQEKNYGSQQRANSDFTSNNTASSQNKENQDPNSLTSLTSWPSSITPATPIGNITMEELAMKMGSQMDHVMAAINEVQEAQMPAEDLECQVMESQ